MPSRSQPGLSDYKRSKDSSVDKHNSSRDGHRSSSRRRNTFSGSKTSLRASAAAQRRSTPGIPTTSSLQQLASATIHTNGRTARRESMCSGLASSNKPQAKGGAATSGSGSNTGSGNANRASFHVPAMLTKVLTKSSASIKSSAYTRYGPSSKEDESETSELPDPYLELQKNANEEIKLKEYADLLQRTKLGAHGSPMGNGPGSKPAVNAASMSPVSISVVESSSHRSLSTARADNRSDSVTSPYRRTHSNTPGTGGGTTAGTNAGARKGVPDSNVGARKGVPDSNVGARKGVPGRPSSRAASSVASSNSGSRVVSPASRCSSNRTTLGAHSSQKSGKPGNISPPELQDEEDDEDDEKGMPQAVRQTEPSSGEGETSQDIIKRLHRDRMEAIARSVDPSQLTRHLSQAGYFSYDYSAHVRTSHDNNNLKYGLKKGIERLYLWLSLYSSNEDTPRSRS